MDEEHPEENKALAVIYANRSAALDAGRNFAACEQDIRAAFKFGYPKHLQFKVKKILIINLISKGLRLGTSN